MSGHRLSIASSTLSSVRQFARTSDQDADDDLYRKAIELCNIFRHIPPCVAQYVLIIEQVVRREWEVKHPDLKSEVVWLAGKQAEIAVQGRTLDRLDRSFQVGEHCGASIHKIFWAVIKWFGEEARQGGFVRCLPSITFNSNQDTKVYLLSVYMELWVSVIRSAYRELPPQIPGTGLIGEGVVHSQRCLCDAPYLEDSPAAFDPVAATHNQVLPLARPQGAHHSVLGVDEHQSAQQPAYDYSGDMDPQTQSLLPFAHVDLPVSSPLPQAGPTELLDATEPAAVVQDVEPHAHDVPTAVTAASPSPSLPSPTLPRLAEESDELEFEDDDLFGDALFGDDDEEPAEAETPSLLALPTSDTSNKDYGVAPPINPPANVAESLILDASTATAGPSAPVVGKKSGRAPRTSANVPIKAPCAGSPVIAFDKGNAKPSKAKVSPLAATPKHATSALSQGSEVALSNRGMTVQTASSDPSASTPSVMAPALTRTPSMFAQHHAAVPPAPPLRRSATTPVPLVAQGPVQGFTPGHARSRAQATQATAPFPLPCVPTTPQAGDAPPSNAPTSTTPTPLPASASPSQLRQPFQLPLAAAAQSAQCTEHAHSYDVVAPAQETLQSFASGYAQSRALATPATTSYALSSIPPLTQVPTVTPTRAPEVPAPFLVSAFPAQLGQAFQPPSAAAATTQTAQRTKRARSPDAQYVAAPPLKRYATMATPAAFSPAYTTVHNQSGAQAQTFVHSATQSQTFVHDESARPVSGQNIFGSNWDMAVQEMAQTARAGYRSQMAGPSRVQATPRFQPPALLPESQAVQFTGDAPTFQSGATATATQMTDGSLPHYDWSSDAQTTAPRATGSRPDLVFMLDKIKMKQGGQNVPSNAPAISQSAVCQPAATRPSFGRHSTMPAQTSAHTGNSHIHPTQLQHFSSLTATQSAAIVSRPSGYAYPSSQSTQIRDGYAQCAYNQHTDVQHVHVPPATYALLTAPTAYGNVYSQAEPPLVHTHVQQHVHGSSSLGLALPAPTFIAMPTLTAPFPGEFPHHTLDDQARKQRVVADDKRYPVPKKRTHVDWGAHTAYEHWPGPGKEDRSFTCRYLGCNTTFNVSDKLDKILGIHVQKEHLSLPSLQKRCLWQGCCGNFVPSGGASPADARRHILGHLRPDLRCRWCSGAYSWGQHTCKFMPR